MLVRIYYFKAGQPVGKTNPVRMLGTNASWTELGSTEYNNKVRNLTAGGHCIFTSVELGQRTIDEVIDSLQGMTLPSPGLYEGV